MDALRQSIASDTAKKPKKPRKAAAGQREMLLPIDGKRDSEKKAAKPERSTSRRKAS
jgi:DNA end-binding protein Ku